MAPWYANVAPTISIPSLPSTYDLRIPYLGTSGWIKLIGADLIHPLGIPPLTNTIPFITDRFYAGEGGHEYEDGDSVNDPGHATVVDVVPGQEVGGVAMGMINSLPANHNSEFGPSLPDYVPAAATSQALHDYIQSLLAAKPYTALTESAAYFDTNTIYMSNTGNITLTSLTINLHLSTDYTGNSGTVLIVTGPSGDLADITFNGNINYEGKSSLVIIAKNIYLNHKVSVANAVFIASERLHTGSNGGGDVPLKIKGNIVALGGIVQERVRSDQDHARPSVLMIFDPKPYFDAMNLLNVKDVEYKVVE
jgi:hypothetical protein